MGRARGSKNKAKPNAEEKDACEKRDTKKQTWFITINNPTETELTPIETLRASEIGDKIKYVKWALEEGEANKVPHIHIVLFLSEQARFSAIKKIFPRCRTEDELKGSNGQLIDYVGNPDYIHSEKHSDKGKAGKKKGGTCTAKGEYGSLAGIRLTAKAEGSTLDSRLNAMQEAIREGKTVVELYELDFPVMIRYANQLEQYRTVLLGAKVDEATRMRLLARREEIDKEHKIFADYMAKQESEQKAINKEIEEDLKQLDDLEHYMPNALYH